MGTKTLDLGTATREQLIQKILNQRENIQKLEKSYQHQVSETCRLMDLIRNIKKMLHKEVPF